MDIDMAKLNAVVQSLTHKTVFGQLETYVPHPKQEPFHRAADVKERWFLAGNRSGKTFACCVEDIWWVTGTHPCFQPIAERSRDDLFWANLRMTWEQNGWGKAPEPEDWPYVKWPGGQIQWRAMCSDEGIMESTLIPVYRKMIPTFMLACALCGTSKGGPGHLHTPSWDSAYQKSKNTIRFSEDYNMGFIELRTYQQYKNNPYSHDSVTLTGVHADEEPPEGCLQLGRGGDGCGSAGGGILELRLELSSYLLELCDLRSQTIKFRADLVVLSARSCLFCQTTSLKDGRLVPARRDSLSRRWSLPVPALPPGGRSPGDTRRPLPGE